MQQIFSLVSHSVLPHAVSVRAVAQSHPKLILGGLGLVTLGGALWWR
jgi:hypothetical protein